MEDWAQVPTKSLHDAAQELYKAMVAMEPHCMKWECDEFLVHMIKASENLNMVIDAALDMQKVESLK